MQTYEKIILQNNFYPDEVQRKAISRLEIIQYELIAHQHNSKWLKISFNRLLKFFIHFQKKGNHIPPVRGLYMWGGVGRGKTWIMDLFFQSIPCDRKIRLHFHHFMLFVHEELAKLNGQSDPLLIIAKQLKKKVDILCFDEFFVSDIADAMILGTLIKAIFAQGVSLVATSNIPPDELYRNGLQRSHFMPTIEQIKIHCNVMNLDNGIDYRFRKLTPLYLWNYPINKATYAKMDRIFYELSDGNKFHDSVIIEINHRPIVTRNFNQKVLAINFSIICGDERSQYDYIELSRLFSNVLLYEVPIMLDDNEDKARRFLSLIDEFYERHVKLVVLAETSLFEIYQGTTLKFEYKRCLSRLNEMQSAEYLLLPHLVE